MKKNKFILGAFALLSVVACQQKETPSPEPDEPVNPQSETLYNVVWCASDEGNTPSYTQAVTDLTTGEIDGSKGFETPSVRSAYSFTSDEGKFFYNYSFGGGTLNKYSVNGGASYTEIDAQVSVTDVVGSSYAQCAKLTDKLASVHNVVTTPQFSEDGSTYTYTKSVIKLAFVDLEKMEIVDHKAFEVERTEYDKKENTYVWRLHAPYISGDKIYYGLGRSRASAADLTQRDKSKGRPAVLILDYPSYENPQIVESGIETKGDTYGFRAQAMYSYDGDLYQLSMFDSHILRIRDDRYDDSYVFRLQDVLGFDEEVTTAGWFYVGDGIGYVPYGFTNKENCWGVARVDLKNRTAVDLNIPDNMDMWEYQNAILEDGILYMAICPVDGSGHIYMFDTSSTSPDGFTKGATLKGAADAYYSGIF